MMNEFPFLIFRKCCYFCARKSGCKGNSFDEEGLCPEFVLDSKYIRFLSTEIFDAVLEVLKKKQEEAVVNELQV